MTRGLIMIALLSSVFASAAAAQDTQLARAFLTQIYRNYTASSRRNTSIDFTKWFEPPLASLLKRSGDLTPRDEVGALNGDPICGCQEWDFRSVAVTTRAGDDGEVFGTASFVNVGRQTTIRFRLINPGGKWQIADIMSASIPSLRQFLQQDVANRTASRPPRAESTAGSRAGGVATELASPEAFREAEYSAQPERGQRAAPPSPMLQAQMRPPPVERGRPVVGGSAGSIVRPGVLDAIPQNLPEIGWDDTDLPSLLLIRFKPQKTSFAAGWILWAGARHLQERGVGSGPQASAWPPFFAAPSARSWTDRSAQQMTADEMQAFQDWNIRRSQVLPRIIVLSIPFVARATDAAEPGLKLLPFGLVPGSATEDQRIAGMGFAEMIYLGLPRNADEDAVTVPQAVIGGLPRSGLRLETRVRWSDPRREDGALFFPGELQSLQLVRGKQVVWEHRYPGAAPPDTAPGIETSPGPALKF